MKLTTTDSFGGQEFEILGIAKGGMVQAKNIGIDIVSGLKNLIGGEITDYTSMMEEARDIATQRLIQDAYSMGADAVICLRYSTSAIMQGAAEVFAYGTAVKLK